MRTYGVAQGLDAVPMVARKLGMRVRQGVWLGRDEVTNRIEIDRAIGLAHDYRDVIDVLISEREYRRALESFAGLAPELEKFFGEVMVMVDNEALRRNRMSLLRRIGDAVKQVADVTKIVVDRRDYRA